MHNTTLSSSAPAAPARVHLGYLDGLRAVAALWVLVSHAWLQVWPVDYNHLPIGWTWRLTGWMLYAHFAVDLFIVLSGFCLMLPVVRGDGTLRGGAVRFFLKRARRILPPYYLAMGFSLLLIHLWVGQKTGTHWDISVPVTPPGLIQHLLLVQDIFHNSEINHAFWSIAVEWRIYFLFPLLVVGWKRLGGVWTTVITLAVGYLLASFQGQTPYVGSAPWYLGLFALGMLAAGIAFSPGHFWASVRGRAPWEALALGSAAVLIVICHRWGWAGSSQHFARLDFLVGCISLCLLVSASRPHPNPVSRCLSWRPLVFIGTFSYSLYLIYAPLLQVVWQYLVHPLHLGDRMTLALMIVLGGPLIVGIAYLFFLVCERPFLTTRRNETPAEVARDVALSPAP